ncbi:MAG: lysophospholipid acyltransferase family protein [Ferruginibacter sp.]
MKFISIPTQVVFTIYAFLIFLALMFILLPLVIVASFFGKEKGGNMIYAICRFWSNACLLFWGIRHQNRFEAPHDATHPCIFVFNHISYMDIPILMTAFRYQHIRVLGKAEMTKVPIFGYIYKKAVVTVDRSDATHRAASVVTLKAVLKKNISVVIAPEGTFNMGDTALKSFYDGAFRIAIETQTPIKPVLFLDALDRMHYRSLFSINPGRSRAIYLAEVSVEGYTVDQTSALKEKVYQIMNDGLRRYNAAWIKD